MLLLANHPGRRRCSSQFDDAQEEQKDQGDHGRDKQRAATTQSVGEEDEQSGYAPVGPLHRAAPPGYQIGLGVAVSIPFVRLA